MAISDRINEMYTHVGDVYDTITNVDVNNGKNLFDYNKITTSAYYTNNYDGSFIRNSNGSSITINVNDASVPYNTFSLLAGTYSVSFDIKTTATVTLYSFFMCTKQNGTGSNLAKSIGVQIPANTTTHIKAENYVVLNNAEKVGFAGYLSASTGVVISNIQVEKGTTATEYQPYTDNPTYKNIENIPKVIRSSYLEIMNNGIDKIWNNWEKVEGTGETLTLNSTEEAPMKINLKGNTSQETTTGKNKYNATRSSATTNSVTYSGDTSKIYINGTPNNAGRIFFNKTYLEAGTYTFSATLTKGSFTNGGNNVTYLYLYKGTETTASWDFVTRILLTAIIGNVVSATFTISEGSYYYLAWYLDTSYTWTNAEIKYQVESGSSFTSFEPYTNGASPNPDYPQDIHVVSGDNYINVVGKNLMDNKAISGVQNGVAYIINQDKSITLNGTSTQAFIFDIDNGRTLEAGTYTLSLKGKILGCGIYLYENNTLKAYISSNWTNDKNTFTLDKKTTFNEIRIDVQANKTFNNITIYPMIEKGSTATEYEAYQGASYPISLGVKNLIDFNRTAGVFSGNGTTFEETKYFPNMSRDSGTGSSCELVSYAGNVLTIKGRYGQGVGFPIRCKPNQSYFVKVTSADSNARLWLSFYDNTGTFISGSSNDSNLERSATSPSNSYWVIPIFGVYGSSLTNVEFSNIKVLEGNKEQTISPTPIELCKIGTYQDYFYKYSDKWYKYKAIHHLVLKGSTNWTYQSSHKRFIATLSNKPKNQGEAFSNFYINGETIGNNNYFSLASGSGYSQLLIHDERFTTKDDFNAWIENNNIEVYYILATPTYTEITDTTLLSQLDTIKRSYDEQTNITQVNNDLPFILDVTALKQLTQ